jgi:uncharacterized lipoprotein
MLPHMKTSALTLAALALVATAACSDDKTTDPSSSGCDKLATADPSAALPAGFPAVDGQVLYEPSAQGKTHIVFGLIKTGDFVKVRDDYVTKLKDAGWTIDGTDQESVEAEAQFSKSPPLVTGTIKVQPVDTCKGYVTVRYKANL